MAEQSLRLFVSSPGDVDGERRRIDLVVDRLNAEFAGRVRIQTVRWELSYYSAHDTFQRQIPEAAECDVVVAVFRGRLGTPLPAAVPRRARRASPIPSGTRLRGPLRHRGAPRRQARARRLRVPLPRTRRSVGLDAPDRAEVEAQWDRLKRFFDTLVPHPVRRVPGRVPDLPSRPTTSPSRWRSACANGWRSGATWRRGRYGTGCCSARRSRAWRRSGPSGAGCSSAATWPSARRWTGCTRPSRPGGCRSCW